MTTSGRPGGSTETGIATDVPAQSTGGKSDRAQDVAGAAADQGRQVADTAMQQARSVAGEATDHARGLVTDALSQVDEEAHRQMGRMVQTLETFSDDLDQMAGQGETSGLASEMARQVANRTRDLGRRLDGREPQEILEDVRGFARRRPGTFLVGALVAGVVAGRFARGAKDASSGGTGTPTHRATSVEPTLSGGLGVSTTEPATEGLGTPLAQPIQTPPGGMR